MSDPEDITADDIVTHDDLPGAVADALEDADIDLGGEGGESEPEDASWIEPEDAAEITERKMTEFMHHLTHESCDTPECQEYRDAFGIDPDGTDSSEGGAEADADAGNESTDDSDDDTSPESADVDADSGNEDEPDESGEPETEAESDGNDTSGSDSGNESDDTETNYLGEEI